MDCRQFRRIHSGLIDDTLPCDVLYEAERHLRECEPCAQRDTSVRRGLLLARNLPAVEVSASFASRLSDRLEHNLADLVEQLESPDRAIRAEAERDARDLIDRLGPLPSTSIGLVDPQGNPLDSRGASATPLIVDITHVNEELLRALRQDSRLMWSLPPRRFEELVAELFQRLGYSVELTPASKDGGFDMFAAKRDAIGNFLYLIECKRYVPPNRVGVEIVRSLHGVVRDHKATAGVIVTTSGFTSGAHEFQRRNRYQLTLRDHLALRLWLQKLTR